MVVDVECLEAVSFARIFNMVCGCDLLVGIVGEWRLLDDKGVGVVVGMTTLGGGTGWCRTGTSFVSKTDLGCGKFGLGISRCNMFAIIWIANNV